MERHYQSTQGAEPKDQLGLNSSALVTYSYYILSFFSTDLIHMDELISNIVISPFKSEKICSIVMDIYRMNEIFPNLYVTSF